MAWGWLNFWERVSDKQSVEVRLSAAHPSKAYLHWVKRFPPTEIHLHLLKKILLVPKNRCGLSWQLKTRAPSCVMIFWLRITIPVLMLALFIMSSHSSRNTEPIALFSGGLNHDKVSSLGDSSRASLPLLPNSAAAFFSPEEQTFSFWVEFIRFHA